ncbi:MULTISPECIES: GNAT family N-acetyltransferase [unclassified Robiginitalea]|uniref:GNAT family N-acetyltransferase n=1 Tax=Robiginitalea TaxID=252306 RepID=UPI00234A430E|nr:MULTISPECIES: GNAT family N-acetyltransferase [unclassified Robiginitalea]MDC6353905.1 GNAT family N-acetyltransferase [Robiginitalea sp. PM2]MDC6374172.1 GNAT family N-acetyltransferase [Robiginitalea sp. SP8]
MTGTASTYGELGKAKLVFDLYLRRCVVPLFNPCVRNTLLDAQWHFTAKPDSVAADRVVVVKDIPDYLALEANPAWEKFKHLEVRQYGGMLIALNRYRDLEDYLNNQLSKRNRKNLRAKLNKLNRDYPISFATYHGAIPREVHRRLFNAFRQLLAQRFQQKGMANRDLERWSFIEDTSLRMIRSGDASLFVIFSANQPIALTLNFHVGSMIYSHMQTYDIAYSSYNLGDIAMFKQLEWCYNNQIAAYDFLIGESYYKSKWADFPYRYAYRIYYRKGDWFGMGKARLLQLFYQVKQFLRDRGIAGKIISRDRWRYKRQRND